MTHFGCIQLCGDTGIFCASKMPCPKRERFYCLPPPTLHHCLSLRVKSRFIKVRDCWILTTEGVEVLKAWFDILHSKVTSFTSEFEEDVATVTSGTGDGMLN